MARQKRSTTTKKTTRRKRKQRKPRPFWKRLSVAIFAALVLTLATANPIVGLLAGVVMMNMGKPQPAQKASSAAKKKKTTTQKRRQRKQPSEHERYYNFMRENEDFDEYENRGY